MANYFDQFDASPRGGGNVFDQFDEKPQAPQPTPYSETATSQALSGVNEGIANTLGFPVDMMNSALDLGAKGINALTGSDLHMSSEPFLGSQSIKNMMGRAITPPSDNGTNKFVRRVGQEVGAAIVPGMSAAAKAEKPLEVISHLAPSVLGSGVGAATAQHVAPDNPVAEIAGQIIGGMTPTAIAATRRMVTPSKVVAPTLDELKTQAGELYDKAERSGVKIPQDSTKLISDELRGVAVDNGLISPTGRVSSAFPKVSEALKTFDDYAAGDMTMAQVKAARRSLSNIAGSMDPAESRIGTTMLKKFNTIIADHSPDLRAADALYTKYSRGTEIEKAIERAGARAGQFSGSGFENALRTEFRALDRNIINGKLRGLPEEEVAAIRRVSRGTPVQNVARTVGKLAPTGSVSFMASSGIPFAIGNAAGGPGVGAALSGATMGAGFLGRDIATRMTIKNAEDASAFARGGLLSEAAPVLTDARKRALLGLLAAQGTNYLEK